MEQALVFAAAGTRYALQLSHIEQVLPRRPLRPMPMAPRGVVGLLRWRTHLLPAVDLSLLLSGEPCEDRAGTRMIVIAVATAGRLRPRRFGMLAERVFDVVRVDRHVPVARAASATYLAGFLDTVGQPQWVKPESLLAEVMQGLQLDMVGDGAGE
jgi:chemotaxis-related protein WspB